MTVKIHCAVADPCPLSKKTFMKTDTAVPIKDIAEVVAENCR